MIEVYLKDIKEGEVCDWDFIEVTNHRIRVYYKSAKEIGLGFVFYAVENIGHDCVPETENDEWHKNHTYVQCVYQGVGFFDGVRHLDMGDEVTDNFGYHYRTSLEGNIETLKIIRTLEEKYCRDID